MTRPALLGPINTTPPREFQSPLLVLRPEVAIEPPGKRGPAKGAKGGKATKGKAAAKGKAKPKVKAKGKAKAKTTKNGKPLGRPKKIAEPQHEPELYEEEEHQDINGYHEEEPSLADPAYTSGLDEGDDHILPHANGSMADSGWPILDEVMTILVMPGLN